MLFEVQYITVIYINKGERYSVTDREFIELRKQVIRKDFSNMNKEQFNAVVSTEGPLLILAGAGSGKTTVVVNRIACLIKYGRAYDSAYVPNDVDDAVIAQMRDFLDNKTEKIPTEYLSDYAPQPWQILAITFTNKAAGELKERIAAKLATSENEVWAGTFHSVCAKMLRRFGERLGYESSFAIYDTDDQKRLMKSIYKQYEIDDKMFPIRMVLNEISRAKDELITPDEYRNTCGSDFRAVKVAELYKVYQNQLKSANAMDFDDIIVNTVVMLRDFPDVREVYQKRFKYVMVDEYQDTNHAQFELVRLLSGGTGNLCVVGDDDQSIYKFRGATIENILSFEDTFNNATVIRLEQNYRSTQNILDAANSVIANNTARKGKNLWTDNGVGEKIRVHNAPDEQAEAKFVVDTVLANVREGKKFADHAVLYRMNAQSQSIENIMARSGVPYRVIGGMRFFERKEIKDILSYLYVIANPSDSVRLRRIINEPKRGIGETSLQNAAEIANGLGVSLYEVIKNAADYPTIQRASAKLSQFCELIESLREKIDELPLAELVDEVAETSGYYSALRLTGEEGAERIENIKELKTSMALYQSENDEPTLAGFLEEVALVTDIDSYDSSEDAVTLMTVHSAKGLEFEEVFLVGLEEGIFPGTQSIYSGPAEIEEERRLAYVGITRAKKRLYITHTNTRMLFGSTNRNRVSRFLTEIPELLCEKDAPQTFTGYGSVSVSHKSPFDRHTVSRANTANAPRTDTVTLSAGDRVSHKAFGNGTVLSAVPIGNDCLVEIHFDSFGTKKLMKNFAKLEKL